MVLVIIALILFGIATTSIVIHTVKVKKLTWILTSILFVATFIAGVIWALKEFSN